MRLVGHTYCALDQKVVVQSTMLTTAGHVVQRNMVIMDY
jgi:hypothetical protein